MELVETPQEDNGQPIGRIMTPLEALWSRFKYRCTRLRRKLPYLVWWNDELDVTVTFSQDKLPEDADLDDALRYLYRSRMAEIEDLLRENGISFDRGGGYDGRDWEWDWSLKGPISIRFRERARKPHLRTARPKPCLVVSNPRPN